MHNTNFVAEKEMNAAIYIIHHSEVSTQLHHKPDETASDRFKGYSNCNNNSIINYSC